ncbi:hypothetical protein [Hymenobacter cheonanensis]|uniref:hypothetical protein n=1 Tax=Hymenobacter sp. CA2-7 TaxID=3063993 RepID=UPI002712E98E|nr:hypothetical protein [Hymenobacter sp. CA2-7]MDO7885134.1 hypothetical protein [Hymenobacter sp. CA2-7]
MSKRNNLYLGKAGHFAAMAEFLFRGWNVAVPEVDVGDDILVVKDKEGEFVRVQVKTAQAKKIKDGITAQFAIPLPQLQSLPTPELTYALMVRHPETGWHSPLIISRSDLNDLYEINKIGSESKGILVLHVRFALDGHVHCSKQLLTSYLNDYTQFPTIYH